MTGLTSVAFRANRHSSHHSPVSQLSINGGYPKSWMVYGKSPLKLKTGATQKPNFRKILNYHISLT